jgi:hypothetical protein
MNNINEFIQSWASMIDKPIVINKMQGLLLTTGVRIFFHNPNLSQMSMVTLKHQINKTEELR